MARVRAPYGSDARRVPRRLQPVVNGSADLAALDGRIPLPGMAGDQQDDPLSSANRMLESTVNGTPCPVECHPVKVDYPVGVDLAGSKTPVPRGIECPGLRQ